MHLSFTSYRFTATIYKRNLIIILLYDVERREILSFEKLIAKQIGCRFIGNQALMDLMISISVNVK